MKLRSTLGLAVMLIASAISIPANGASVATYAEGQLLQLLKSDKLQFVKTINVNALEHVFLDWVKRATPLTEGIISSIAASDWDTLTTTLDNQNMDAESVVSYLIDHMNNFRATISDVLRLIPTDNALVKVAVDEAKANLNKLDTIKAKLAQIKPYSKMTPDEKALLVKGLKLAVNSAEFAAAQKRIVATYNDVLLPAFDSAQQVDLSTITAAAKMLNNKYTSGSREFSLDDFPVVIDALNTVRTLAPLLPSIVEGFAQTFFDINQLLMDSKYAMQAPQVIQNAASTIALNANLIKNKLNSAFTPLDQLLAQAQQELNKMTRGATNLIVPESEAALVIPVEGTPLTIVPESEAAIVIPVEGTPVAPADAL